MNNAQKRNTFSSSFGFVLAAAGSAVGLGNIWRFPYLAAKDGGGLFLVIYLILAVTFGFALLTTEVAIGRTTKQSPLTAYKNLHEKWGWLGKIACVIPMMIMPYYCVIGGWVLKYAVAFVTGQGAASAGDSYFTGFMFNIYICNIICSSKNESPNIRVRSLILNHLITYKSCNNKVAVKLDVLWFTD